MSYDKKLDACLFIKTIEVNKGRLSISVYSYNNGPKKIQITRENKTTTEEFRFSKLGRISKEEMVSILPLIQEAISIMK